MLIDLSCPVENRGISVRTNSETGENYLLLKLLNISEKTITALNFDVVAFDENGNETATLPVELTELNALPKEFFAENKAISISDVPNGKNFIVNIKYALFEDGETYEPSEENTIDYDDSEARLDDALMLRELIPDAVCFAKEYENYWRCPCGRPNFKDAENCARCGLEKETILSGYSSKSALDKTFEALEEEKIRLAQEEEQKKAEKKKKTIKNIIISAIIVVSLAVLALLGFFTRNLVLNIQAGKAIENNDYIKAYELYKKSGSSKIADVINEAMGNTPINLMSNSGFLADDEENLYYITRNVYSEPVNLIKENKSTNETTILTDMAYNNLNVVGDYVYFINTEGFPCRITKDGKNIETLSQTQMLYMCVIGSDIYYLKTDYDNPKGYTEEECQILASQGQMKSFTRIYKLDLNTNKDILVSEEAIYVFSIYGDRIYFFTPADTEDSWLMSNLKSMNLNGEDIQSIIDAPVNSFFVEDDVLYYIPCFDEKAKGTDFSDLSLYDFSIKALDLKTNEEKVISDKTDFILSMNTNGEAITMLCLNKDEFIVANEDPENATFPVTELKSYDIKTGKMTALLKEDAASLNVCKDAVFSILTDGQLAKYSPDTASFKTITEDGSTIDDQIYQSAETE